MKLKKIIIVLKFITFFLIFNIILFTLGKIFAKREGSYNFVAQNAQYQLTKNSIDAVACGSSTIELGLLNLEIYHNTGIKMLLNATTVENLKITYYKLKELYKYQTPKVAIIDLFLCDENITTKKTDGLLHFSLDIMKSNFNKMLAINSLKVEQDYKLELVFPILCYHSNWKKYIMHEENSSILSKTKSVLLENSIAISTQKYSELSINDYKSYVQSIDLKGTVTQEEIKYYKESITPYIDKIIKLANKYDTKLIFTCFPKIGYEYEIERFEILRKIYENYENIEFINLALELQNIDCSEDFADKCHLNYLGAQKVTEYFIHYLQQNYEFEKTDVDKKIWEESYIEYLEIMEKYVFQWGSTQIGDFKDVYVEYY